MLFDIFLTSQHKYSESTVAIQFLEVDYYLICILSEMNRIITTISLHILRHFEID